MNKHNSAGECFEFLKNTQESFLGLAESINFDGKHIRQAHIVFLYASLLELMDSCIFLLENDRPTGMPIILRTLLENSVDIKNLIEDACYGYTDLFEKFVMNHAGSTQAHSGCRKNDLIRSGVAFSRSIAIFAK